jgi:hypothetical protein
MKVCNLAAVVSQGCFPWWAEKEEIVAKKAQGKEINGKSNNLNNW